MNELERLIELSKVVAKPWVIATITLAILLALSVSGNIYMVLNGTEISFEANSAFDSMIE